MEQTRILLQSAFIYDIYVPAVQGGLYLSSDVMLGMQWGEMNSPRHCPHLGSILPGGRSSSSAFQCWSSGSGSIFPVLAKRSRDLG